jgi:hypothetical protein
MLEIERKLIPRLKLMSYIFFTLSLASLLFILTFEEEELIASPTELEATIPLEEEELAPTEVLNFYFVSFVFAAMGTACLLLVKNRTKKLFAEAQEPEESCPDKD